MFSFNRNNKLSNWPQLFLYPQHCNTAVWIYSISRARPEKPSVFYWVVQWAKPAMNGQANIHVYPVFHCTYEMTNEIVYMYAWQPYPSALTVNNNRTSDFSGRATMPPYGLVFIRRRRIDRTKDMKRAHRIDGIERNAMERNATRRKLTTKKKTRMTISLKCSSYLYYLSLHISFLLN